MKNLIAISAAALTAASASAGIAQYSGSGSGPSGGAATALNAWETNSFYASRTVINDTLQFAVFASATSVNYAAPGNGYHTWANWTATTPGTSLSLSGGYLNPNQSMTATPGGSSITVTFDPATQPTNPLWGIMGAGLSYTVSGTISGMVTVAFQNGLTTSLSLVANSDPGFIGVWMENPAVTGDPTFYKIASMTISTSGSGTLTIDSIHVGLVPAPGAVALVGVAGLVGSRRRRA